MNGTVLVQVLQRGVTEVVICLQLEKKKKKDEGVEEDWTVDLVWSDTKRIKGVGSGSSTTWLSNFDMLEFSVKCFDQCQDLLIVL